MAKTSSKLPLYKRLEYSSLGATLGSLILLAWGVLRGSDDALTGGIWLVGMCGLCWIALRLANHSRPQQPH